MQPLLEIMEELAEDRARVVGSKPMTSGNLRNVTTPLLGALVVAALDRRAYNPSLPLESVHEVLMSAISGLQV